MTASPKLLLALQYGGVTHPWNSGVVVGLLVGACAMILLVVAENAHEVPKDRLA